ncbi:MAG: glycosyltransferase family 39 protein [Kofleriaceae bacterium]|nr:glycosyltransferase family 39 protein [Kofleriaceae bacterium]
MVTTNSVTAPQPARRQRWLPRLIAAGLFVVAFALVNQAQREVGIARDETVYMTYGSRYADWWTGLFKGKTAASEKSITAFFGGPGATDNNREHPPLLKTLSGLSERWLHRGWGVNRITAYRVPAIALNALLIVIIFAWVSRVWGQATGLLAALLTLFLPRAFFHAGLACFDGPIVTLWIATLYAYWRGLTHRGWRIAAGVIFGLALATKHNAILLPFVVGPHYLGAHAVRYLRTRKQRNPGNANNPTNANADAPTPTLSPLRRLRRSVARHGSLGWPLLLGPLTLVAVWPWLWHHPLTHIQQWLAFHFTHVHYNFEYLGQNWNAPRFPWHVALVTTLVTVPAATLAAAGLGISVGVHGWFTAWRTSTSATPAPIAGDATTDNAESPTALAQRQLGVLLALSAAASMGPFFLGSTPIFGAEKHWAPAIPSLCIAAALGITWAARRLRLPTTIATIALGCMVVSSAAIETRQAQPYGLSYYNAFAGGASGGADLGMNRQFWGIAVRGVLPFLATIRDTHKVYTHDAAPAWGWYQNQGLVAKSLADAGPENIGIDRSDVALVVHEKHFLRHDYMIWKSYGTVQPIFVLRSDGVPIVSVYRRPSPPITPSLTPSNTP